MKDKYDIFVSYRREGGYDTAKHLNDLLVHDGYRVSFDIDTLRSGDFDEQLYDRIDQCEDFILIVDAHAFDRSLDPKSDPTKDWLRCELAYALKKGKNIIPVFLAGVKGFPENLPEDIQAVEQKNGPEYNRYYFNDFYRALKTRFLSATPYKRIMKYAISAVVIIALILFGVLLAKKYYVPNFTDGGDTDTTAIITPKDTIVCEQIFSCEKAKEIATSVLMRRPLLAYGYNDEKNKIAALMDWEEDDIVFENTFIRVEPKLSLILLIKEGGIWSKEREISIDQERFYNDDIAYDIYIFNDTCQVVRIGDKHIFHFHFSRNSGSVDGFQGVLYEHIAVDIEDKKFSLLSYFITFEDVLSGSGRFIKDSVYPKGVEEFLLDKLENDTTIVKVVNEKDTNAINTIVKNWYIDNPLIHNNVCDTCDSFDFIDDFWGYEAKVRYYKTRPSEKDYENNPKYYTSIDVGDYTVYSSGFYGLDLERWTEGCVYAYDKKEKRYFLIWADEDLFNLKTIWKASNDEIYLTNYYISDEVRVGEVVDVFKYNLKTHKYTREKNHRLTKNDILFLQKRWE